MFFFIIPFLILMVGQDKVIKLWDLGSGRRIKSMTGHTSTIYSLEYSRDGSLLASGSADETARIWDVKKSDEIPIDMDPDANDSFSGKKM